MSGNIVMQGDGDVATVVLRAPDRLNALNMAMWDELRRVFEGLDADDSWRCIIIRGHGDKAFAAGADIADFEANRSSVEKARAYGKVFHGGLHAVANCRHPVVAQIQGACVGGGLELACCCDIRICGESSRFGVPVNRLGLVMAYQEMGALVDLVGKAAALEIVLEGRVFGAEEARDKGLVNRIVADHAVETEALATAERIAAGAPLVARWHKKFVSRLLDPRPLSEAELDEGFACFGTDDFQIGYKAFLAKEKPDFKGR